jgi:hypothetical protein
MHALRYCFDLAAYIADVPVAQDTMAQFGTIEIEMDLKPTGVKVWRKLTSQWIFWRNPAPPIIH